MIIEPCSLPAHVYHALIDVFLTVLLTVWFIFHFRHPDEQSKHRIVDILVEAAVVALLAGFGVSVYFCTMGH